MNPEPENLEAGAKRRRPGWLRRLYDWTVGWSERKGAVWALFLIAVIESSVFPIPPDVLLLALAVGSPQRSLWFATVTSVGSVIGGMIGYWIGHSAWHLVRGFFIPYVFPQAAFDRVQELYQGNAFLAILSAAFTPIPYKVFTVAAGVFEVGFATLVIASVKVLIEKYFDWLAWVLLILGIGGFVAIKFLH
jgi:membrane protein YqaA with SNARE-associated domain